MNFDGSGETKVYSGISYGTYLNLVNDKLYVLDYAIDQSTGQMPAIARQMEFDGTGLTELPR